MIWMFVIKTSYWHRILQTYTFSEQGTWPSFIESLRRRVSDHLSLSESHREISDVYHYHFVLTTVWLFLTVVNTQYGPLCWMLSERAMRTLVTQYEHTYLSFRLKLRNKKAIVTSIVRFVSDWCADVRLEPVSIQTLIPNAVDNNVFAWQRKWKTNKKKDKCCFGYRVGHTASITASVVLILLCNRPSPRKQCLFVAYWKRPMKCVLIFHGQFVLRDDQDRAYSIWFIV